jgi:DNA-binding transcriptional MerR regulator
VDRLARVLTYRSLDFSLEQIAALLDDPNVDEVAHLRGQRELLVERGARLEAVVAAIDRELEARAMGIQLTPEEQLEVFGTDKYGEYAMEAEERWGETETYRESRRRAATYTKEDWARLKEASDAALRAFRDAMTSGVPAAGAEGMALAERHRTFLCTWFYECSYAMHRDLAEMYVADDRFSSTFDIVAPGLAAYVRDSIIANSDAHLG